MAALALALSVGCAAGDAASEQADLAKYVASSPLEPALADQLRQVLEKSEADDVKLRMEITRRIDFYFYVSEKIDSLMKTFRECLIPFIYQRDLFQGNPAKNTSSILRAPLVTVVLNFFIQILQPFYIMAIMITGVYLLFVSGSPLGRAKAKSTLVKLVIGLGLITMTIPITEMLLESSHYIASFLLDIPRMKEINAPVDMEMFTSVKEFFMKYFLRIIFFDTLISLPFLAAIALPPIAVLTVLSIRYFMVILLTVTFPFTVLSYSFMATKRIGNTLLNQMIVWIFVPVIDALILLVTWNAYKSVPYVPEIATNAASDIATFIVFSGYVMLVLAPFIAMAMMAWIRSLGLAAIILKPVLLVDAYFEKGDVASEDAGEGSDYENIKEEVENEE